MVYEDREDEFMMDDQELYADDGYSEQLADTFREQIPGAETEDGTPTDKLTDTETLEDDTAMSSVDTPAMTGGIVTPPSASAAKVEDSFGESINPETNPHLEEQLEDARLNDEAEREYREND